PHGPLVLDAAAMARAGIGPDTPLPDGGGPPPWKGAGLAHVPCRAAPLLTTRREADAWGAAHDGQAAESGPLAEAVAEAAAFGHDESGRFRPVADWLRSRGSEARDPAPPGVAALFDDDGWAEWEPVAGADVDGGLLVVRQGAAPAAGWVLAALLAAALWWGRRRPARGRARCLLLSLGRARAGP